MKDSHQLPAAGTTAAPNSVACGECGREFHAVVAVIASRTGKCPLCGGPVTGSTTANAAHVDEGRATTVEPVMTKREARATSRDTTVPIGAAAMSGAAMSGGPALIMYPHKPALRPEARGWEAIESAVARARKAITAGRKATMDIDPEHGANVDRVLVVIVGELDACTKQFAAARLRSLPGHEQRAHRQAAREAKAAAREARVAALLPPRTKPSSRDDIATQAEAESARATAKSAQAFCRQLDPNANYWTDQEEEDDE